MEFKKIVLSNGIRVLLVPRFDIETMTVLILARVGSKHENKKENGISHFLEHMCFKGTKKRPNPLLVIEPLDEIGAVYNAFTSQDFTGYWIKADSLHSDFIIEMAADIFLNSIFDPREVEKEKKVIEEEINMIYDNPHQHVEDLWFKLLYGDQPPGWPITGTKKTIKNINQTALFRYKRKNYTGLNILVCLAGNFSEKKAVFLIKKYFSKVKKGKEQKLIDVKEKQTKPQILQEERKTDQTHLILGFRAIPLLDPRRYPLELLAKILGGMMSSRLFLKIRIEKGLAYYISAGTSLSPENGSLEVSAGLRNESFLEGIDLILKEIKKILEEGIEKKELEKAKENAIGSLKISLETSNSQASFYSFQELLEKKIEKKEKIIEKIEKITEKEIFSVAKEVFQPRKLNLAFVGPKVKTEKIEKIFKNF